MSQEYCPLSALSPNLMKQLAGLAVGMIGASVFWALHLPLPWMLGALVFTMITAISGVKIKGPERLRPIVIMVIGVLLGSRFSPEVLGQAGQWIGTLTILVVCLLVLSVLVVPFYRYFGKLDWTTAYFAGMPGGLAEMIELGESRGGKPLPIILAHSFRVVFIIAAIGIWFRVIQGVTVGSIDSWSEVWSIPAPVEILLLLMAALGGAFLGKALRIPAPMMLGPMIFSAVLHLGGLSEAQPPQFLVIIAQVVLGTVLGCKFYGLPIGQLWKAAKLAFGATLLSLGVALAFAELMVLSAGIDLDQGLLTLAPGGLTEMALVALAIKADAAFVALHHVVRIVLVIAFAPIAYRLLDRKG